ncbi:MAG TPA: hypothetical protein VJG32_13350 [Anaerolineae bacterium]|nr:hypothetical protein [Anaerolineae bacterium]
MRRQARAARQRAERRQKRFRAATFAAIVMLVLGLTGYLLVSAFSTPELPEMAGGVIDIAADMSGFDVKEVRVTAGKPVTVRLTSLDNTHHLKRDKPVTLENTIMAYKTLGPTSWESRLAAPVQAWPHANGVLRTVRRHLRELGLM